MPKTQLFKCRKCNKEKKKEDGYLKLGGLRFCCKKCCDSADDKKGNTNVCRFC